MQGLRIVASVIDANTYTFTNDCTASGNATGGGSVTSYDLPETSTHIYKFKVIKQDIVC